MDSLILKWSKVTLSYYLLKSRGISRNKRSHTLRIRLWNSGFTEACSVLLRIFSASVLSSSPNPDLISDQSMLFSIPISDLSMFIHLWFPLDQKV